MRGWIVPKPKRDLIPYSKSIILLVLTSIFSTGLLIPQAIADDGIYNLDYSTLSVPMSPTNTRWAYQLIQSAEVNGSGVTGAGVTVALLDNGIDPRVTNISRKVVGRFDATYSVSGHNDHGTGTSSIVAADPVPEAGIGGVAPGASVLDVRVCVNSNCRTEWIIAGLKWAIDNGANVISMSLGGGAILEPATAHLIQTAISRGIVVVASAGNNACVATYTRGDQVLSRNCTQASLPYSYPGSQSITGLITVGAIGRDLTRNSYSNYGAYVDVVAPGTDVATFYPWGPNAYFAGTSAAAPMVAGIAALIKQVAPNATPEQVQAILQTSTTDPVNVIPEVWESCAYVNNLWDCQTKSPARWPSRYYVGAGVVNAQKAVLLASELQSGVLKNGLSVTSQDSALTLDWASAGLNSGPYKVLIDGKQIFETSNTSIQVSALNNSSQYSIQILDSAGIKTSPLIGTPKVTPSFQVPTISMPQVTSNAIYLTVATEPEANNGVLILDNGDQSSCIRSGTSLRFDCTYISTTNGISGKFKLVDPQGNFSLESNSLTFSYSGLASPATINVNVISETEVTASWSSVTGATNYCFYDAGAGAWIATTNNSTRIIGLRPGLPQTFTVFASNSNCNATGLSSPTYWFLPFGPALLAPVALASSNLTANGVDINFQAPSGADRYAIYRSDGKNWITNNSGNLVSDTFSNVDQGRTFSYWITAIDDVQYGSQYGAISSALTITVPPPVVQSINNQSPATGSSSPSGNLPVVSAPVANSMPVSSITNNPRLKPNSVVLKPSSSQMKLGSVVRVAGSSKSGVKLSFSVSGPCEITSSSGSQITIRGIQIGNCQVYALASENSKFNAADRLLTIPVGLSLDTLRVSGPSKVGIGREFKVSATTKSRKPIGWTVSGPCEIKSQSNSFATLRAIGPSGNCTVTASTSDGGGWAQISKSTKVSIR